MKIFRYIVSITCLLVVIAFTNSFAFDANQIKINNQTLVAPEATGYQWYHNGEKLNEETLQSVDDLKSGTYKVELTNLKGETTTKKIVVSVQDDTVTRIFVIGDSTASNYGDERFPRTGWAQVLQPFFDENAIEVVNRALSGRSSKSFHTDPNGWPTVLEDMTEGDFLFIQFGHNDAKSNDPDRYTEPYSTFQEYLSTYIDSARAKGAHPVLLTPIHRNGWSGSEISDSHGDYPPAMRALAEEKDVPLIDLHNGTEALFESLGKGHVTDSVFMNLPSDVYLQYPDGNDDDTHLQINGAHKVSRLVADSIEASANETLEMLQPNLEETGFVKSLTSPLMHGTIEGKGVHTIGDTVTLTVEPKDGFAIANWSENDNIVSEERAYSFVLNADYRNISANMETGYEVDLKRFPFAGGETIGEGNYVEGAEVALTAISDEGYDFVHWKKGDEVASTDSIISFTMGAEAVTYQAIFEEAPTITSSEQDKLDEQSVHVFPNPADKFINVSASSMINKIEIFDLSGRSLFQQSFNDKDIKLSLNSVEAPLLILKITTENGVYMRKVLVR